jgi:hypothetical protein
VLVVGQPEKNMSKKLEKLKRVVSKLSARYGPQDPDVQRIQAELVLLSELETNHPELAAKKAAKYAFQSSARQLYIASTKAAPH